MQVLTLGMPPNLKDISILARLSYPPYSIIKCSAVFSVLHFLLLALSRYPMQKITDKRNVQ